ncbi:uncharacterized protein GGS22DRAFT_150404 [Annulohypoxylon maeteangense]|uniref:uncharacterized protein n=1 Tax=Annulohypoxylon maeteangense TaxID=1927788 RepID=UPI002008BFB5|nr:uncharacterized protein GGS22DRAFT_150404 [Annulohypoxylon maeteangense]KAI0890245.1 hypothetical protein GGS22DRAFT_150404 [Annulohypoxylon maeteangense]
MDSQPSIVAEKASLTRRPVPRPADEAGPSNPSPVAELAANIPAGLPGGLPAELPADDLTDNAQHHMPPPYSSPSDNTLDPQLPRGPQYYPGLPVLDYRQYSPPMFELSTDTTTITSKANYLSENPKALASLLRSLATVPPKPQVLIQGQHDRKINFSLKLNLMNLMVSNDPNNRFDYLRCVGKDEMALRGGNEPGLKPDFGMDNGLEAWCDRYVKDSASIKTFTLERVVANLDTAWIEGQIRSLVASTDYKGQVTVQFPVSHAKVVIQNPDKHNKFLTSVTSLFSSKSKYEVVKAVWPFASARNGEPGRRCVVQNEKTWWEEWRDPIKYGIATKRQGWVTNEDKLECIMEGKAKGISLVDWGPSF